MCLEHVFQRLNEVPYSNPKSTPPSHLCKNINLANISSLLHQKFPLSGFSSNNMLESCPSFRNKNKKTSLTVDLPSALIPILIFPHTAHLLRVRRPQSLYPLPPLSFSPIHILIQAFEPITPIKPHFPKPPRSFPFAKSSGKSQRSSDRRPLPVAVSLLRGTSLSLLPECLPLLFPSSLAVPLRVEQYRTVGKSTGVGMRVP